MDAGSIAEVTEAEAPSISELFRRFLQAYWLRPENALWMTLRSEILASHPMQPPCIDLSCGDGIFSFLHAGGAFHPDFDVFGSVQDSGAGHNDMFDCLGKNYRPEIASPPARTVDVGTDWKTSLLSKAQRLDFYGQLVRADHNAPLPFEDASFQTTYCNAAYWIAGISDFLGELRRITRPVGCVILQVKLDVIRKYTFTRHRDVLGDRFLEIIDRGRTDSWPTLADRTTWERRFRNAGFVVSEAVPFVSATHAHLWDVGLRPVAPLLIRMASGLNATTRTCIKRDWVELFHELLTPLCRPNFSLGNQLNEPVEMQYVLRPK